VYREILQNVFRLAHFPLDKYGPPHWKVTPEIIGELRVLPYLEQWKRALQEGWYHVKLEDHSLFIFSDVDNAPSYSFLHSPVETESFRIYLSRQGLEYSSKNRSDHLDEYEMLFETASLRSHVTPIRLDVDRPSYRAGVHPMTHIHIGLDNSVRLAVQRELSPLSFVLFVMRQMYPVCWSRLLERSDKHWMRRVIRTSLPLVAEAYWSEDDQLELHLT
jgi:hypothetical protein